MAEALRHAGKTLIPDRLGIPITPEQKGIRVGNRHFDEAIALIGDGTGLEALKAAKANPRAAVFVIDPFANHFAGTLYTQLADPHFKGINWSFFTDSPALSGTYDILTNALAHKPDAIAQIEREYGRFHSKMETLGARIFLADGSTHSLATEAPVFDEVRVTYPESNDILAGEIPPLFSFLNNGLREGGTCHIVTDIFPYYEALLKFAYPMIVRHGRSTRNGKVKDPLSLYDALNGSNGYFYVHMEKNGLLPEMSPTGYILRDALASLALLGLVRGSFGGRRKDLTIK